MGPRRIVVVPRLRLKPGHDSPEVYSKNLTESLFATDRYDATEEVHLRLSLMSAAVMPVADAPLPEGWREVASRTRPGEVSYLNTITGRRVLKRPVAPAVDTSRRRRRLSRGRPRLPAL